MREPNQVLEKEKEEEKSIRFLGKCTWENKKEQNKYDEDSRN